MIYDSKTWEFPYELLLKSYSDGCKYYGDLKKEGKLIDMNMSEFADYYREKKTYTEPECALWGDMGLTSSFFGIQILI